MLKRLPDGGDADNDADNQQHQPLAIVNAQGESSEDPVPNE